MHITDLGTFLEETWWLTFAIYFIGVRTLSPDLLTRSIFHLLGGLFAIEFTGLPPYGAIFMVGISALYAIWDLTLVAVTSSISIPRKGKET